MQSTNIWGNAAPTAVTLIVLGISGFAPANAQTPSATYQQMAAAADYLMPDRAAEVALARSGAPAAVSSGATVMVLTSNGYQTAADGTNGFTCLVERSWHSPFDHPEFWNPKIRSPVCYNPAATRSILPDIRYRTKLAQQGLTKAQMLEEIRAAIARNVLSAPEAGAMSFMMSKDGHLSDADGHWHPHLMFYVPTKDLSSWGANLPGSPVVVDSRRREDPERYLIFLVLVSDWSDGSPAAAEHGDAASSLSD